MKRGRSFRFWAWNCGILDREMMSVRKAVSRVTRMLNGMSFEKSWLHAWKAKRSWRLDEARIDGGVYDIPDDDELMKKEK